MTSNKNIVNKSVLENLQDFCKDNPPQSLEEMTIITKAITPLLLEEMKESSTPMLDALLKRKPRNG